MPWNNIVANFKSSLPAPRCCFIVGATGEVGKKLVEQTLISSAFEKVVVVTRRSIAYEGPNKDILEEKIVKNFDCLGDHPDILQGCQFGFCCLGTTRAKAGSVDAFRKVDYDYIIEVGRLAKTGGCQWLGLVSSAGASSGSWFLYPRTKGQTEAALAALELPHLFIYRAGLLMCNREEWRSAERAASWIAPAINALTKGQTCIATETVAQAMIIDAMQAASAEARGEKIATVKIISNKAMVDLVKLAGCV